MTAIFNFLMIAGAVQGFVFIVATFLSRKKVEKPILFLNLLVLFLSLNNLQSWVIEKELISLEFGLHSFTIPWYVLIAPTFYTFLLHYLEIEEKKFSYVQISVVIFLLELITRLLVIYMITTKILPSVYLDYYNNLEDSVTFLFSLFLFYKAIQLVFNSKALETIITGFDDLRWLKWFFYLGGIVFVFWIGSIFFNITGMIQKPYSYYPLRLGSSILIYWIGYQAFFRYIVLKDRILLRKEIRRKHNLNRATDLIKDERREIAYAEVDNYVQQNQKFLNPNLSLESLATELNKSTSGLSKLLNDHAQCNFSDYINGYRVEEAKKLLADEDYSQYTIVAIGLECGFNSKSAFYTAFKKFVGLTPSAFKNSPFS